MSRAKVAHQATVTVESTSVGARYRMTCSGCDARTPLVSKVAAESAKDLHEWETER